MLTREHISGYFLNKMIPRKGGQRFSNVHATSGQTNRSVTTKTNNRVSYEIITVFFQLAIEIVGLYVNKSSKIPKTAEPIVAPYSGRLSIVFRSSNTSNAP